MDKKRRWESEFEFHELGIAANGRGSVMAGLRIKEVESIHSDDVHQNMTCIVV